MDAYSGFGRRVKRTKRSLLSLLIGQKNAGRTIWGYGAPGKDNTLPNYRGIGRDFLQFTMDCNPYRHGRFTPGMHVPFLPVPAIGECKPDLMLLLPWNLKDEIASQMRPVASWGCKFVVPVPEAHIIDPSEVDA